MIFKELRQNNTVYMLDKREGMKYTQGKVLNVGQPRIDTQLPTPGTMQMPQTVVDVTIEANGKTETYKFPDNVGVAAVGSVLFSTDKEGVLKEVQATISDCEQYLSQVDAKKEMLEQGKSLIAELDTTFKEKQEIENRISKIEKQQEEHISILKEMLSILKKES
jgi:chaperonin cofactor prefoldin